MIVLDTNVLSALMREEPDEHVVAWLDRRPRSSVWTTSITVLEIQFGLGILPPGRRRSLLVRAFDAVLTQELGRRVAPFDQPSAERAAQLMASRHRKGTPVELRDTMIAGIVLARHATLATRNIPHFSDLEVPVVNPWVVSS